jgi:mannosidase alpha-like ER degradation enhancer 1
VLAFLTSNEFGCKPFTRQQSQILRNETVLLKRGECFFYEKVRNAEVAGAKAVLIINSDNSPLQMSPMEGKEDEIKIPSFMISRTAGMHVLKTVRGGNHPCLQL